MGEIFASNAIAASQFELVSTSYAIIALKAAEESHTTFHSIAATDGIIAFVVCTAVEKFHYTGHAGKGITTANQQGKEDVKFHIMTPLWKSGLNRNNHILCVGFAVTINVIIPDKKSNVRTPFLLWDKQTKTGNRLHFPCPQRTPLQKRILPGCYFARFELAIGPSAISRVFSEDLWYPLAGEIISDVPLFGIRGGRPCLRLTHKVVRRNDLS